MWLFSFWSQFYNHIILCCCWGKQQTVASAISMNREISGNCTCSLLCEKAFCGQRGRNSVLFSNCCLILITCAYFLSDDCTICYIWDKNIIEIEHANFNQAAYFVNRVVKLTATRQPCPIKISIYTHTHQSTPTHICWHTHIYSLTNTPGRT